MLVQCSGLGQHGQFGNSLFQYAFAKSYAQSIGAELQTPPWIGQKIFKNINDPPIIKPAKMLQPDVVPNGEGDIDLIGCFQCDYHVRLYTRSWAKSVFTLKDEYEQGLPKPKDMYVAAHVRHGDYLYLWPNKYAVLDRVSYEAAFQLYDVKIQDVLWFYMEDKRWPNIWPYPRKVSPHEYDASGTVMQFLPDFKALIDSDILFRANSTFSYWAGVLHRGTQVYAPLVGEQVGFVRVPFVKGNWPKCYFGFTDPHMTP